MRLNQFKRETKPKWWWLTLLFPVVRSHTPLIPGLERWRKELIWLGREKNKRQEDRSSGFSLRIHREGIQFDDFSRQNMPFGLKIL